MSGWNWFLYTTGGVGSRQLSDNRWSGVDALGYREVEALAGRQA